MENNFQIGDMVTSLIFTKTGVVVGISPVGIVDVLWADGTGKYKQSELRKTGETMDIQGVLKQLGDDKAI